MKNQLQTIRHTIEMATPHYQADTERFKNALTALDQIEAAVGAQEPVAWTIAGEITDWSKNFSMYKTQHYTRPVFAAPLAQQPQKLEDIEQYRMQMAAISTAAIGYWKEGVYIHPDYDTVALRDVAKLYAKYDELYKAQQPQAEAVPNVCASFYTESAELIGTTEAPIKRVEREDDGTLHVYIDHCPQQAEAMPSDAVRDAERYRWLTDDDADASKQRHIDWIASVISLRSKKKKRQTE